MQTIRQFFKFKIMYIAITLKGVMVRWIKRYYQCAIFFKPQIPMKKIYQVAYIIVFSIITYFLYLLIGELRLRYIGNANLFH